MLTTTTKIVELSRRRTILAHVVRIPLDATKHEYYMAASTNTGEPIGLVTNFDGRALRRWTRYSAVEEILGVISDRLVGIYMIPAEGAEREVKELFIRQYGLDKPIDYEPLEVERRYLVAALREEPRGKPDADGKAPDPADA